MVTSAQASGEVRSDLPADRVAAVVFSIYLIEVRRWLANDRPKLAAGVEQLRDVLGMLLQGILASKGSSRE